MQEQDQITDFEIVPDYKPALSVPQELILNIAIGMEEPEDIARRYGFEGEKWRQLESWPPFRDAVQKQQAELQQSGLTFKIKARSLTEDVFEDAYKIARGNDVTLMQKLEFIKLGAKLADMEPKANTQVASGPGFSISINFSTPKSEEYKKADVVDIEEKTVQQIEKSDE